MPQPLLAIDAPSVLFRAYYALPSSIKGSGDRPVNALLGSVNIVLREVLAHRPRAVVMCFGQDAADYRVELFSSYHEDRAGPAPEGLDEQWEQAPDLFEALGWPSDEEAGFEADDLLGSYALAEQRARGTALILSGDRDMYQLASDRCRVLYLKTGARGAEIVDGAEVVKRYGVPAELVPDFIALRGDPSDGIPGARGIGQKTAAALLRQHGSLEAVIAAADQQSRGVRLALREQAEQLLDFKDIATLREIEVERPPDRPTDFAGGAEAARSLGMNRLAERLEALAAEPAG
jgi:5'-3' exonuclease